jgi:deoxyribodipyrimidine photolyase-related protein
VTALYFVGPWDLNRDLACVPDSPRDGRVLLVESKAKSGALPFHRKKLVLVLSAMHHFAAELRADGFQVEVRPAPSYAEGILAAVRQHGAKRVVALEPREWGLAEALQQLDLPDGVELTLVPDGERGGHFLISREEFNDWASSQKGPRLRADVFYRWMRRRTGWLLEGGKPLGGKWSYDADNRERVPQGTRVPRLGAFPPDALTRKQMKRVAGWSGSWGSVDEFDWPVTRADALVFLEEFVNERLECFGSYEDAMVSGEPFLWHSCLSVVLNLSLLSPREVCEAVLDAYSAGRVPLNSAEGLIRQVAGWREFIRGIYWLRMPGLRTANLLGADRPLPACYWDPQQTDLNCLRESLQAVEAYGYAHHIQRLMVLGNFALLTGVRPLEVSHWFWAAFVDAYEWVELPNVHGMALYADDSFTTKPYAASGAYINRMSDYCKGCKYDVKQKTGPKACPFNTLFWDFMVRNRELLSSNPRLGMLLRTWDKRAPEDQEAVLESAAEFLANLAPADHSWTFDDDAC